MSIQRILLCTFSSALLFAVCLPLGAYSYYIKSVAAIVLYAITGVLLSRHNSSVKNQAIVTCILGVIPLAVYSYIHLLDLGETLVALPSSFAFIPGLLFSTLWFRQIKKSLLIIALIIITPVWSVSFTNYMIQTANYRSVKVGSELKLSEMQIVDNDGNSRTDELLRNKLVVLNFWNTGCGVCKREFPEFNRIFNTLKGKQGLAIVSVNVPLQRDSAGQALHYITQSGYSFPVYFMSQEDALNIFGISSVPTILMIVNGTEVKLINNRSDLESVILTNLE